VLPCHLWLRLSYTQGAHQPPPILYTFLKMSVSFDITEFMLYREYSDTESSAIHCISIFHNHVTIAWKTNPEKQYIFKASDTYAPLIREIVRDWNPTVYSIGSEIAEARKSKQLVNIEI